MEIHTASHREAGEDGPQPEAAPTLELHALHGALAGRAVRKSKLARLIAAMLGGGRTPAEIQRYLGIDQDVYDRAVGVQTRVIDSLLKEENAQRRAPVALAQRVDWMLEQLPRLAQEEAKRLVAYPEKIALLTLEGFTRRELRARCGLAEADYVRALEWLSEALRSAPVS